MIGERGESATLKFYKHKKDFNKPFNKIEIFFIKIEICKMEQLFRHFNIPIEIGIKIIMV